MEELAVDQSAVGRPRHRHHDGRVLQNRVGHDDASDAGGRLDRASGKPGLRVYLLGRWTGSHCSERGAADGRAHNWLAIGATEGELATYIVEGTAMIHLQEMMLLLL